jgi:MFS family permease
MKPTSMSTIIGASSVGTMIEWYDFYIFGMLSTTISSKFFPKENPTAALLSTLAIFAAGFIVRPFGALVFGRLGDLVGRKHTFMLTLVLMGASTFLIGCVPGHETIGIAAPIIVLILRLIQGLALGGEYGGAATYVAEHSTHKNRGFYTSWIQTTATLGLFIALGVILLVKSNMSDASFNAEWGGWRIPFLISIFLVGISIYIRLKMKESPLYTELKVSGKTSVNPIAESFRHKTNFKMVLLALFGAVMGQGVVWYTGQFYAQNFLETKCYVGFEQSRTILLWAILLATPFFIFWGWLSDRIGRKWIMMLGMFLAIMTYRPIFSTFLEDTDGKRMGIQQEKLISEKKELVNSNKDSVISSEKMITYTNGMAAKVSKTDTMAVDLSEREYAEPRTKTIYANKQLPSATYWKFVGLVFLLILYVTMVYGPIAAFLVEMFPTKIRYTSMSLPYHIGNGVFGGLVPFIGVLLTTTYPVDPLVGLWYPIGVAFLCLVIGTVYLENRIDKKIND